MSATAAATSPITLEVSGGIATMTLDEPGKKVNTLSTSVMAAFERLFGELEANPPKALILRSAKPDCFVAGADIEELVAVEDVAEVRELLSRGHALMSRLGRAPFPSVAAIHGSCLGGGLELALACDWRVATEHDKTKLGLPEVQLGLIPGLGGTQRLPRLIGVPDALDMILTGKQIPARRAKKVGLVDEICHPSDLDKAVAMLAERGKRRAAAAKPATFASRAGDLLARSPLGGKLVYEKAEEEVRRKTGGHYPAPLEAIEVVHEGMKEPLGPALGIEADAFARLVASPVAKNLMGLFFMKNDVEGRAGAMAKGARPVGGVAVLGAGLMGAGIAQVLAHRGVELILKDRDDAAVGRGMGYAAERFEEMRRRRRLSDVGFKQAMARLHPQATYRGFDRVDFVVEAVFEDLAVKHSVLREVEAQAPESLIFASNTSTIPIAEIAQASKRPEQVVGMHFFSPVHKMPLLEIIRHPGTSEQTVATTVALGKRMGKTIIVVGDGPGFFTSRVLGPFCNEAALCLAGGAKVEEVDKALTRWGWPVGALTLLDEVGIDIAAHAGSVMRAHLGERFDSPPAMERLIADKRFGRKAGRGFYRYDQPKKVVDETIYQLVGWAPHPIPAEEIAERCFLAMLNEIAFTIMDGVIENPKDIDIGVIFGFGFPPFRGGILREADRQGIDRIVARLEHYAGRHGARFTPAGLLVDMAKKGARFHAG